MLVSVSVAAFACILFWTLFYVLFVVPTKFLKVEKVDVSLGVNKKVLQISDIHMKNLRVDFKTIRKVIEKEKPSYIFITGDFIDENESEYQKLSLFLDMIKKTGVPTYSVLGNHDRYVEEEELVNLIESFGVRVLRNQNVDLDEFVLIGIDDFCDGRHDIEASFYGVFSDKKKIVITHDPNIIEDLKEEFDYMLSGHLHGKQFNIPYFFHIKNMGSLPKRGIYKGKHNFKNGQIYISKGLGQSRINLRFFVRSEITIHYL